MSGKSSSATFSFKKGEIANFLGYLNTHWHICSLGFEFLYNSDSKGAKRSAMNRTMNILKVFSKNILSNVNRSPSKIRSLHKYDIPWMFLFEAICTCNHVRLLFSKAPVVILMLILYFFSYILAIASLKHQMIFPR